MIIVIFSWSWQLLFIKGWSRAVHSGMYPKVQWKRGGSPGLLSYGSSYVWQIADFASFALSMYYAIHAVPYFVKFTWWGTAQIAQDSAQILWLHVHHFLIYIITLVNQALKQSWQYMQISSAISGLSSFLVKVYLVIMSQNTVKSS